MSYSTVDVRALRTRMRGTIVTTGEASWDTARAAWRLTPDQRPVALALPETPQDVAQLVEFAQIHGLPYSVDPARPAAYDGALVVSTARIARAA